MTYTFLEEDRFSALKIITDPRAEGTERYGYCLIYVKYDAYDRCMECVGLNISHNSWVSCYLPDSPDSSYY